jgi:hypothetical protein
MKKMISGLTVAALLASSTAAMATRPDGSLPTHAVSGSSSGITAGLRAGPTLQGENDLAGLSPAAIALFLGISIGLAILIYDWIHDSDGSGVTP